MNVSLITMPKAEARRQLKAVRTALHRKADTEYEALEAGYREIANGRPLIDMASVFRTCPVDAKMRPRLAIARADRRRVNVVVNIWRKQWTFDCAYDARGRRPVMSSLVFAHEQEMPKEQWHVNGYALVPIVPPQVKGVHDLSRCHVLWEVEQWADTAREVGPDVDPYLVRYIGGELYAVLGEWDLTPLEQAVMRGRVNA